MQTKTTSPRVYKHSSTAMKMWFDSESTRPRGVNKTCHMFWVGASFFFLNLSHRAEPKDSRAAEYSKKFYVYCLHKVKVCLLFFFLLILNNVFKPYVPLRPFLFCSFLFHYIQYKAKPNQIPNQKYSFRSDSDLANRLIGVKAFLDLDWRAAHLEFIPWI